MQGMRYRAKGIGRRVGSVCMGPGIKDRSCIEKSVWLGLKSRGCRTGNVWQGGVG